MNDYYRDHDNNNYKLSLRKILVPIDSSKPALSERLTNHAIHIAQLEQQKKESNENPLITMLNVIEDIKQGGAIGLQAKYGNVKLVEGFKKAKEEAAIGWMIPLEESAKKIGLNIKSVVLPAHGKSLSRVITNYVNQNNIDLIVIGAEDLFKLKYLLVGGSVTGGIIKNCKCPIMLIR